MTHVPYPGCYCADCVEGGEPIGYINAEMLNRKSEFEANGMVMFDRPCGAATMPLYAEPPSARITGDKDRENPVEGAPLEVEAADRLRLWFFRECNSGTRRQLFGIFGLPLDEIRNQGAERLCFNHILAALGHNRQLAIECHRLRNVLRWIADTAYVDHQSGNQNFEHLQSIARDALTKEPTP